MLTRAKFENFGPLAAVDWDPLDRINLVIGGNGSGKTFLLKALYSAIRTLEEYQRGKEPRPAAEILADKLYWTFQADRIGDLVRKKAKQPLKCRVFLNAKEFSYSLGKDTTRQITSLDNHIPRRESNSVFLPAKEVLSLYHIILESREQDKVFGFDDTYLDLARALRRSPTPGRNYQEFSQARHTLEEILGGKIEYDEKAGRWQFRRGNQRFPIGVTAEGYKKIAILDTLLGNRYLSPESVVFIDEPEAALHPTAISKLLDIVAVLAEAGIQFFLASHSYFVVKKLYLIAQQKKWSIPVLSAEPDGWRSDDLLKGMPDNAIIDESIRLYEQEVELALQ